MKEFFGQLGGPRSSAGIVGTRKAEDQEPDARPQKAPRQLAGKASEGRHRPKGGRGKGGSGGSGSGQKMEGLLEALARLTLRHEDMHQIQRLDTAWVLFMKTPVEAGAEGGSTARLLMAAAHAWKAKAQAKEGDPGGAVGRLPLRTVLGQTLAHALHEALQSCSEAGEARRQAEANGWLQANQWCYQKWVPDKGLLVDATRTPLSMEQALAAAKCLQEGFGKLSTLNRFHALHPLVEPLPAVCPFMMDISLREAESNQTYHAMEMLSGCAALQTINVQWRKETLKRSALAVQVQNLLG